MGRTGNFMDEAKYDGALRVYSHAACFLFMFTVGLLAVPLEDVDQRVRRVLLCRRATFSTRRGMPPAFFSVKVKGNRIGGR